MTTAELIEQIRSRALELSKPEREQFARELFTVSEEVAEIDGADDMAPEFTAEIKRRIADIDNGVTKGMTPAQVMASVNARFGW